MFCDSWVVELWLAVNRSFSARSSLQVSLHDKSGPCLIDFQRLPGRHPKGAISKSRALGILKGIWISASECGTGKTDARCSCREVSSQVRRLHRQSCLWGPLRCPQQPSHPTFPVPAPGETHVACAKPLPLWCHPPCHFSNFSTHILISYIQIIPGLSWLFTRKSKCCLHGH